MMFCCVHSLLYMSIHLFYCFNNIQLSYLGTYLRQASSVIVSDIHNSSIYDSHFWLTLVLFLKVCMNQGIFNK